ncbi:MAG: hypothetical protein K6F23_13815 [Solobacterium sp.]|nr:hypothetical protein [Solobacterium sp.]
MSKTDMTGIALFVIMFMSVFIRTVNADVAPGPFPGGNSFLPLVLILCVIVLCLLMLKKFFRK